MRVYNITPVPKPRQTARDRWAKRPPVLRYRAFADECRAEGVVVNSGDHIIFYMPMPASWSKKKRSEHSGQPHTQRPDVDNCCKAILDAINLDDSHIYDVRISKVWSETGLITIQPCKDSLGSIINARV